MPTPVGEQGRFKPARANWGVWADCNPAPKRGAQAQKTKRACADPPLDHLKPLSCSLSCFILSDAPERFVTDLRFQMGHLNEPWRKTPYRGPSRSQSCPPPPSLS